MRQTFGVDARYVWSAPGRVNIVGEFTDISHGISLTTLIPHRIFMAATPRQDSVVRISTDLLDEGGKELRPWESDVDSLQSSAGHDGWTGYPAGVLWALLERGYSGRGMDIAITSCLPSAVGLSSSTALAAATALAANGLWGLALKTDINAVELAEVCMDASNDVADGATAGLAEHAVLRGSPGEALFLDFGESPPLATACPLSFAEYGLGLLIIDTQVSHPDQAKIIRERMAETDRAVEALGVASIGSMRDVPGSLARIEALDDPLLRKRARHVFTENERVELVRDELTGTGPAHERFVAVGKAMYRSHASLEVDFDVSGEALNLAVDVAFNVGALGARLLGTGRAGSAVALIRRSQATVAAQRIDAKFRDSGLPRPVFALF